MKRWLPVIGATLLAFALAGFLAAWTGLVPVAASAGHWRVTSWFLHFTMHQSVSTRALGIEVPPLDDQAMVMRGASHYENGCAPCHGAQGDQRALQQGRLIARYGVPEAGIPACSDCHGPAFHCRNPHYPTLGGQYADYIVMQLELFRKGQRGRTAYNHIMETIAGRLNAEQMQAVALYYASLGTMGHRRR